ncbi:MAG: HpaII family restriction endonuclease [Defluviitaleaceae bacterium]|nr:HpaII family restriction endonuclease [Defluviitaleaceae bacterium]
MKGNKGEWSEIYVLLRLLADGRLNAADEKLLPISDMYFPIIKILREEIAGQIYKYLPNNDGAQIEIYLNDECIMSKAMHEFEDMSQKLFHKINSGGERAFLIPDIEEFVRSIFVNKLKVSTSKEDILIQSHDILTGYQNIVGFSIKSDLGSSPTLLNATAATNFVFTIKGLDETHIEEINAINTPTKLVDRMARINDLGGVLAFEDIDNVNFKSNLTLIDSQMPKVVAEMLLGYYVNRINDCSSLVEHLCEINPLSLTPEYYRHKISEMLCAFALGMTPSKKWSGTDAATGGYIIVKKDGDVLAYHIYNRDAFKGYLLANTRLERGSSTRHGYCTIYRENNEIKIKLNLQVRFMWIIHMKEGI